ncbi:MAG: hypothetical protein PHV85_08910 [Desulfovibrionaceae bacterium]|nr:hypothetical protein [Desulfovibrionaceae bacterium]MDD4952656.1 hypothetical protein [Desulfovibrionaceae bacterium]
MSGEITLEGLDLKKPLDKMTAKELRQLAMDKIPSIVGASGMTKEALLPAIKEACGVVEEEGSVSPYKDQIFSLKRQISELRTEKVGVEGRKDREIMRRKINKLKKRTRRLSRAV